MGLLKWAFLALIIALVAALFGYGGIAQGAVDIAKFLFFLFVALFVVLLVLGITVYRSVAGPSS